MRHDYRAVSPVSGAGAPGHKPCGSIGVSHADPIITSPLSGRRHPSVAETFAARFVIRPVASVEVRPAHQPRPAAETLDAGQCRIWLNECRREIDRLRAGREVLATRELDPAVQQRAGGSVSASRVDGPSGTLADPPTERKLYAVDPLAVMPDPRHPDPVERPPRIRVLNHYHVTNLGTLLDVLA